jgi:S-DNA-T family DNA segregation ATPase FtsK/SpoIIIE
LTKRVTPSSHFSRAMYEPVSQSLRDLAAPGIMLSSSPDEGALVGRVKGSAQPPGRGRLVSRELGEQVVQLAWLPSQHP